MDKRIEVIGNPPLIRAASTEDLGFMLRVENSAFPENRRASLETLRRRLELFPQGCFIAEQDGEIAGFETALLIRDVSTTAELDQPDNIIHDPAGKIYYLRSLAIKQEFQRRGIGKAMMEQAIKTAKELKKHFFRFTAAQDVEKFYAKLGFKRVSEYQDFHGIPQAVWELKL